MTRRVRFIGRDSLALIAGIAVETAYVLGLSALGLAACLAR
jgi:hypothetical protein